MALEERYLDFDEYIRQGEPDKREKAAIWQTAIGLQAVDGLTTSDYLKETARRHIEGEIGIDEAGQLIDSYYKSKDARLELTDNRTEEADKVSQRITKLLEEQTFVFAPGELVSIHRRLFKGVYDHAGKFRSYNITKQEWVLDGETVLYSGFDLIKDTLDYDFAQEKAFDYTQVSAEEAVRHIARFMSGIWQIHPFGEGNTRTMAVFAIKYLRKFGFFITNDPFKEHSWNFRNALVRANYTNIPKKIYSSTEWLELFFRNMLLGEQNELRNRYLHIRYQPQSATEESLKCKICTLNCTLEESAVIAYLKENPRATQKEIAAHIRKSERTVKTITVNLTNKNLIERKNGKRNGYWEVK